MKISRLNNARSAFVFSIFLVGACLIIAPQLQANEVQVGRYSMLSATPTEAQADLLATTIKVQLPKRIHTIGEAIHYLLQRSGFRLAGSEAMAPETIVLFDLPLPAVHRNLGPISLRKALETLAGPAYQLVQDPMHRLIAFEPCVLDWKVAQGGGCNTLMEDTQHGE